MNSIITEAPDLKTPKTPDGETRPANAPLDEGAAESFRAVQPEGFKDHPRSSIDAAVSDPDMDDTEGGE